MLVVKKALKSKEIYENISMQSNLVSPTIIIKFYGIETTLRK